jgi:hypothetical protein
MRITLRAVAFGLICSVCFAQAANPSSQSKDSPQVTFKKQTRLVQVPVVVTTDDGKPVRGLTKEDLRVFQNNKEQPIATFEEVRGDSRPMSSGLKLAPGVFSNTLGGKKSGKVHSHSRAGCDAYVVP